MDVSRFARSLVFRIQNRLCAIPLDYVVETMRALPIEQIAGSPSFVTGLALVRGTPIPVVDLAQLSAASVDRNTGYRRFVTIKAGGRVVALAVDDVIGVVSVPDEALTDLPPVLRDARAEALASIGSLDSELLLVLRASRLIPDDAWFEGVEKRPPS